jgi:hypothetical protein
LLLGLKDGSVIQSLAGGRDGEPTQPRAMFPSMMVYTPVGFVWVHFETGATTIAKIPLYDKQI